MLVHYFVFYKRIKIYEPIAIGIKNIPYPQNIALKITGITTFNKTYIFLYDEQNCVWGNGYSFIKSIDIELDSALLNNTFELTITVGKESTTYDKSLFIKEWQLINSNNSIQTYKLPEKFSSKSFWGSYFSVFVWKISQRTLLGCFIFLVLYISIIKIKKRLINARIKNRKWLLLAILGYGILVFVFIKEIIRLNNRRLEGISFDNALIFIVFLFFVIHLIIEFLFIQLQFKSEIKRKIRLLYLSVMFILICVELSLRILNVNATYSERVFYKYSSSNYIPPDNYYLINKDHVSTVAKKEFLYQRTFNAEGLPDIEHYVEKDSGALRIMAIGDSFTEGVGADFDSTWVSFLSYKMIKRYPLKKIEFFNAGIVGSDPFFEYLLLKDKLLKYKPDMVLLAINTTDVSDYLFRGGFERFLRDSTVRYNQPPKWEPLYAYSYTFRLLIHNLLGYDFHFLKGKEKSVKINRAVAALHDASIKFYNLSQKNNFKLVLILHPQLNEAIKGNYFYDTFASAFKNDKRLDVVDLLPFFKNKKINSKETACQYYWPIDQHHNAKGYKLFADGVFEFLQSKRFIDESETKKINGVKRKK